jgi:DNA helicase HerA-like ATPase
MGTSTPLSNLLFSDDSKAIIERPGLFHYVLSEDLNISIGDYVIITLKNRLYFGQVDSTSLDFVKGEGPIGKLKVFSVSLEHNSIKHFGYYNGEGKVLSEIIDGKIERDFNTHICSGQGEIRRAQDSEVDAYFKSCFEGSDPLLPVGALRNVSTPIRINVLPKGLNRNTGIFGQSGSGKSFALSILIEELHFRTKTDIVILDPNGDFVNLKGPINNLVKINHKKNAIKLTKDDITYYKARSKEKEISTKVLSLESTIGDDSIYIRLSDLKIEQQANLFGLNPNTNKDEYHNFINIINELKLINPIYTIKDLVEYLRRRPNVENTRLYITIENLGIEKYSIWNKRNEHTIPLVEVLNCENPQTIVVDLSNVDYIEKNIISALVLFTLWNKQLKRKKNESPKPTFLVVDEAHNLFPNRLDLEDDSFTLELGIKIAGEGRKFGLYLLIASQLPSKIHEHILTQCGNLVLMKMLSQSDLDTLNSSFSYVSEKLIYLSRSFSLGDAILIGSFVPSPSLIHFESKKTAEGGKDMEIEWL